MAAKIEITYDWWLDHGESLGLETDAAIIKRWQHSPMLKRRALLLSDINRVRWRILFESEKYPTVAKATADWYTPTVPSSPPPNDGVNTGQLRIIKTDYVDSDSYFANAAGETLPLGITYGPAMWERRVNRGGFQNKLESISRAGYDFIRSWCWLGYYNFWRTREISPVDYIGEDGQQIKAWDDWEDQVRGFGEDVANAGLQLFVSSGDARIFSSEGLGFKSLENTSRRLGQLLDESGVRIVAADQHEPSSSLWLYDYVSPTDITKFFINPLQEGYVTPFIHLIGAAPNNTIESLNTWSGDMVQKHGSTTKFPGDHVSVIDQVLAIMSGKDSIPNINLGIETEPNGPGLCPEYGGHNDAEVLCLIAAANFIGRFAYVYHSQHGVRPWEGLMSTQPGFNEIPKIRELLTPLKLHSSYRTIQPSGAPFIIKDGKSHSLIKYSDDHFITIIYGHMGRTTITAQYPVEFTIITPDTREARKVTLNTEESLTLSYKYGRIIIGQFIYV